MRCHSPWFILRSIESDPGHNALTIEPGLAGDPAIRGGQRAVFLSYASEDAAAARRVCESLRAAGVEVWFDESELRGGDVWDHKIRREIRDCALFVPIISQNTQARTEGYFRLEWRLAEQRTHLMAKSRAFLVPVCIDDTLDADADVHPEPTLRDRAARHAYVDQLLRVNVNIGPLPIELVRPIAKNSIE